MMIMIKNACVYLINKYGYVMMIKCRRSRLWMTAGGKIEKNETPYECMIREFNEETNQYFPVNRSRLLLNMSWKDTQIFLVLTDQTFQRKLINTRESCDLKFIHYKNFSNNHYIKRYVKNSFRDLNIYQLIESNTVELDTIKNTIESNTIELDTIEN